MDLSDTPAPNHFNAMQARLERDLINTQDHIENLWTLVNEYDNDSEQYIKERDETIIALKVQREQINEFMKYMRLVAGISLEFPDREARRKYLRANNL